MIKYKILFVDHTPFIGGAQLALVRHLRHLDRSHFTPVVFCSSSVPELVEKFQQTGAKVLTFTFGRLKVFPLMALGRLLTTAWRLGKTARQEKVSLIVANSERAFYPALLVSFMLRKKLILWVRDFEYPRFLLKAFDRWVSKFVFVSRAVRDYYHGWSCPKATVVYVGTDLFGDKVFDRPDGSILDPSGLKGNVAVGDFRRGWGLERDGLAIGFAGRLVAWKGVQVLLAAARMMKEKSYLRPRWKIIMAGEGYNQEGSNEQELRQFVLKSQLKDCVVFAGFQRDMLRFYQALDILVHPSLQPEPFATVVVEAMAAGLSVVASRTGGTPEIIHEGENGLLFPPGDTSALAVCLGTLLAGADLRRRLGRRAYQTVAKDFTEERVTREMEEVYREMVYQEVLGK